MRLAGTRAKAKGFCLPHGHALHRRQAVGGLLGAAECRAASDPASLFVGIAIHVRPVSMPAGIAVATPGGHGDAGAFR